jgi:hypothetical protein
MVLSHSEPQQLRYQENKNTLRNDAASEHTCHSSISSIAAALKDSKTNLTR